MKRSTAVILIACCFILSCKGTQKKADDAYICKMHGQHRLDIKESFCACFGISPEKTEDYLIFSREGRQGKSSFESCEKAVKNEVADEIVAYIVARLNLAFGDDLLIHWELEKIDLPIVFRTYLKTGADDTYVKVVAVARKEDFTPRALIKFLPLEYKMKLLKPEDKIIDPDNILK
jgi:hypothetical protein